MEFPSLSFDPSLKLQDEIWCKLGVHVIHYVLDHASFHLVAAFGRCKLHLFE
jgi:hypothetical protein